MDESQGSRSFLSRLILGAIAGGILGLLIGGLEGAYLLVGLGIGGAGSSVNEIAWVQIYYGMFCVPLGALAHGLLCRRSLALASALTAGITIAILLGAWAVGDEWVIPTSSLGRKVAVYGGAILAGCVVGLLIRRVARMGVVAGVLGLGGAALAQGAALVLTSAGSGAELEGVEPYSGEPPPNVVLLLIDTLRADRLSCYGYERPTSPVLDELASRGTRFDAAYAHAPWTRPSVASLMTGLYPASHDILTDKDALPPSRPTLGQLLDRRGYQTAAFSANPQVSPTYGFDPGFDRFYNTSQSKAVRRAGIGRCLHLAQAYYNLQIRPLVKGEKKEAPEAAAPPKPDTPDALKGSAAASLNRTVVRWVNEIDASQPYFLYVQYIDPHSLYAPPEDLLNEGGQPPVSLPHHFMDKDAPPYPLAESVAATPEVREGLSRLYDAEIRYVDREIGKLLDHMEEKGLLENTYVIVTSDHGEEFHEHKQWLHGQSLFDELVRVPFLVIGPDVRAQVIEQPVGLVDVLKTVAGWAGAPVNFDSHGRDLRETLTTGKVDPQVSTYMERDGTYAIHSVRLGTHKVIRIQTPDETRWLQYDLASDPLERNDLVAGGEPDPTLKELFETQLLAAAAFKGEGALTAEATGAAADALAELGYVDPAEEDDEEADGGQE